MERRLDQSGRAIRDVDALFDQLSAHFVTDWPEDAEEALTLAARAHAVASAWAATAEQPSRALRTTASHALTTIYRTLRDAERVPRAALEVVLDAWANAPAEERGVFADVLLDGARPAVRDGLQAVAFHRLHAGRDTPQPLNPTGGGELASRRELSILHARIIGRGGDLEGALGLLDAEPIADERVGRAIADVLAEAGEFERAVDRLSRVRLVASDRKAVSERIVDLLVSDGRISEAVDELLGLLEEHLDIAYWKYACDLVDASDPAGLPPLRESLSGRSQALHVEVLIADGDVEQVASASRAKTFSYEQLWRIGDFLATHGNRKAARVYERAINLQGAVSQSKLQCADLGARLEGVIPFFESIERPTKPRRLARDLLARNKNNIPMKREFERIFGDGI